MSVANNLHDLNFEFGKDVDGEMFNTLSKTLPALDVLEMQEALADITFSVPSIQVRISCNFDQLAAYLFAAYSILTGNHGFNKSIVQKGMGFFKSIP